MRRCRKEGRGADKEVGTELKGMMDRPCAFMTADRHKQCSTSMTYSGICGTGYKLHSAVQREWSQQSIMDFQLPLGSIHGLAQVQPACVRTAQ